VGGHADPRRGVTERLPDLELPDHGGNVRRLSELVGGDPTILHSFRGPWCPKEQRFFRRLVALQDELEVAYCRLLSLSVDPPEVAYAFRAGLGARWTFLCDHERTALRELGLRETTDTVHDPYVPRVFVLRPDLTVAREYDGYWFVGRPTTDELLHDLRTVSAAVRPDWRAPAA
jgi:peroxiredoxin